MPSGLGSVSPDGNEKSGPMLSRFVSENNAGGAANESAKNEDYDENEPTSVRLPAPTEKSPFGGPKKSTTITKRVVLSNFND